RYSGTRPVDGPFTSCAIRPSLTWPSRTSACRCSWPRADTPACGRCSATPALEPKRLRRSPQLLIPPDGAADLDKSRAQPWLDAGRLLPGAVLDVLGPAGATGQAGDQGCWEI